MVCYEETKMYNGWTNWETWNTALWFAGDAGYSAQELREIVEELFSAIPQVGLARDLITNVIREINFEEISKAFALEEYEEE